MKLLGRVSEVTKAKRTGALDGSSAEVPPGSGNIVFFKVLP